MAEKLSIRIQLEGAAEVEAQLEALGDAGKQAFVELAQEAEQAGKSLDEISPEEITKKLEALGVTGEAAFGKIAGALKKGAGIKEVSSQVAGLEDAFTKFGTSVTRSMGVLGGFARAFGPIGIAAAVVTAALGGMIASAGQSAEAISKISAEAMKVGIDVEQFDQLRQALEGVGISAASISSGIAHFGEQLKNLDVENLRQIAKYVQQAGAGAGPSSQTLQTFSEAAKGTGEAAKYAQQQLEQWGYAVPGAGSALQKLGIQAGTVAQRLPEVVEKLRQMPDSAERTALAFELFGKQAGPELVAALQTGGAAIDQFKQEQTGMTGITQQQAVDAAKLQQSINRLSSAFSRFFTSVALAPIVIPIFDALTRGITALNTWISQFSWAGFVESASKAAQMVLQFFAQLPGQIAGFFAGLGSSIWQWFVSSAQLAAQQVVQFFAQLPGQIASYFAGFGAELWDGIVQAAQTAWRAIVGFIDEAIQKVKEFFGMGGGKAAGAGAGGKAMAHGGLMGGRGSGTSDSNLAWLSRGEHVMPARAVRQPGVLQLLEALRRSGGNLRGVLDRMGHFAMGGMVRAPAFASGGVVGGMSNVTIHFPGVQPITGLRASSAVVEELRRSAALAQVRSGGRKPSRYT